MRMRFWSSTSRRRRRGDACNADQGAAVDRKHCVEERLERVHQPEHVGVEHRAEYGGVLTMLRQRPDGYARVADHDIGSAEAADEIVRRAAQRTRVANIAGIRCAGRWSECGSHGCQRFTSPCE